MQTASETPRKPPEAASLPGKLQELITGGWKAQAVYVAAELRLADLLADGPRTSADLAGAGADATAVHRLLRALSAIDICQERPDGSFEITPLGALLGTDQPGSLRSWAIWWGAHLWPLWGNLLYSVRTGGSARKLLLGTDGFDHLERDRETAAVFNEAFRELTRLACRDIVQAYDFSGFRRVADIGGGYGQLLAALLQAYPHLTGILFDLPHAVDGARAEPGMAARCEFVTGDFFQSVPSGADAFLLKNVLHDWNDERAGLILRNCRSAMTGEARLLVIEQIQPDRFRNTACDQSAARSDLTMLIAHSGCERTGAQYRALLGAAGFQVTRIVPAGQTLSLIEARPV